MSTVAAILPAKQFETAKQRLAPQVQLGSRRALVESMFSDAILALRRVAAIDQIFVVTSDPVASQIAAGHNTIVVEDTASSHSEAAQLGITRALEMGATRALLVPGDCPLLDPTELEQLIARPVPERSVLIVPDRHGEGTNALLLTPADVMPASFGEGSRQRHTDLASTHGATPEVVPLPSLALDIDTPGDLEALLEMFATTRGRAAHTRGMLSQLTRSQA
ncbi:MAG TPA: 2-phospho-L-lactate guanylyltransferase [Solirubrobacteraceae bacterium]|jgi:2-phospho-L-lactate guanylyltransferase|nr:2-phospho-L-lactate guanylyltransferase [Solirubrobacteraceae bacterium]